MQTGATTDTTSGWVRLVFGRRPRRTFWRIATLIAVTLLLYYYVFLPIRIVGISMAPNFSDGRLNLVYRPAYHRHMPARGDVIALRFSIGRYALAKRVIALPGETIEIVNGVVRINGEPLTEPYVRLKRAPWNVEPVQLTADEVFVIGDNRSMDQRDHTFGRMARDRFLGRVMF